ncbi:hypothetical protein DL96DRAFT_1598660 [Flagelloscypha sp. PMI_526]|nr:hypothetical protein DL96DRAFT_1598660 [Flagelloscypha sp. PMI_526]
MSTTLPQPTSASSDNPSSPCPESRTPNAQHKPSTEVPATANPLQTSSDQDTTSQSHATAIPPFPPVTAPIADQDSSPSDMAPSGESVKPPLSGSETQMFKSTGAMTPITPNDSTPATPDATTPTAPQVATPTTPEEGPPTDPEVTTPTTPTTPKPTTPPAPDAVTLSAPNASQQAAGHASLEAGLSTSDKIPPPISTNDTKPTPDEKHISPSPISRTSSSEARFPVDDSEAEDDDERPLAALKKLKASNNAPTVAIPEDEKEEAENEHGTPIDATTSAADTGLSTPVEGDPWLPSPSSAKKKKGKKNKKDVDATNTPLLPAKSEEDEEGLEHVPVIANISGSTPVGATAEDGDFANSEKDDGTKTLHGAPAPAENGGDTEDKPVERTQSDEQTTPITPVAHDSDGWTTQTGGKSGGAKGGVTSRLAGLFGKGKETGNISPGPGPKDEQSETNKEDIGEGDDEVQDDGASEAGQEKPLVGGSGPGASKKKKKNKGKKK